MTAASFNGLRNHLASSLTADDADDVMTTLREAMKSTKQGWGHCGTCNKAVKVDVQDATAAVQALKLLIEQLEGRPGVQSEGETGPTVVISRTVGGVDTQPTIEGHAQANAQAHTRDPASVSQAHALSA